MKKLLILFLIPIFLLAGCSDSGSDEVTKSIQVVWENQDSSSASGMIASLLTDFRTLQITQTADIQLDGERFTQTPTPLGYTVSHVKANLYEDGVMVDNAKFDFAFENKSGNIRGQGNNYADITFDTPGTGIVNVKHNTLTKKVTFHVLAAAIVDNIVDFGNSKPGFNFETGQGADEVEAVIVMGTDREVISKYPFAKIPRSGYWEEYYNIKDVTGLTYQPAGQMWGPDVNSTEPFNYNYAFKLDNGYAKMMVNHYQNRGGDAWGFVYDYSQTGHF